MQLRVSSSFAAITSLFLLFAGDFVVAQISAPICTDLGSSWQWSFNSLKQNPCIVTAYLMATCYGGVFAVEPLFFGDRYSGPSKEEVRDANPCWCNTVAFNLISACGECQGGQSILWSDYLRNCSRAMEPSTFPNPVPAGTRIPQWALLDITRANFWSASTAQLVGNTPEIFPGEQINILASLNVWPSTPGASSPIVVPAPAPPVFTLPEFTPRRINRRQTIPSFPPVNPPPPVIPDPPDPFDNWPFGFPATSSGSGLNTGAVMGSVVSAVTTIAAITSLVLSLFS